MPNSLKPQSPRNKCMAQLFTLSQGASRLEIESSQGLKGVVAAAEMHGTLSPFRRRKKVRGAGLFSWSSARRKWLRALNLNQCATSKRESTTRNKTKVPNRKGDGQFIIVNGLDVCLRSVGHASCTSSRRQPRTEQIKGFSTPRPSNCSFPHISTKSGPFSYNNISV